MQHFLFTSGLVCLTLLLTGAMDRQSLSSATPRDEPFLPSAAAGDGAGLLDHVLTALSDPRIEWLQTNIRQRMFGAEPFEAEGRFVQAPGQRLRLELKIKAAGSEARVLAVSDGRTLRQTRWLDGTAQTPTVESLPANPKAPKARAAFLDARGLTGPPALLRQIRPAFSEATQQPGTFHGRPAILLSGVCQAAEDVLQTVPVDLRARRCNIILDAQTFWPLRIEWIGSPRPRNFPVLLLRLDFSKPVVNRVLAEADCRKEFLVNN